MDKLLLSWSTPKNGFCVNHLAKCGSRKLVISLTNGKKNNVVLVDLHTSQKIAGYDFDSGFPALAAMSFVSNSEQAMACCTNGSVWMFDIRTFNQPYEIIKTHEPKKIQECSAGAVNSDGCTVALGITGTTSHSKKKGSRKQEPFESDSESDDDGSFIELWDMRDAGSPLHLYKECHSDRIQALNFSSDDRRLLISGDADGLVNYLNITFSTDDDALQSSSQLGSSVNHVNFLSGSRAYATSDDSHFEVFRLNAPDDVDVTFKKNAVHGEFLVDILDIDCETVCSISSTAVGTTTARFFSGTGEEVSERDLIGHSDLIRCITYDPDERLLIMGDDSGLVTGQQLLPLLSNPGPIGKRKKNKRSRPY